MINNKTQKPTTEEQQSAFAQSKMAVTKEIIKHIIMSFIVNYVQEKASRKDKLLGFYYVDSNHVTICT